MNMLGKSFVIIIVIMSLTFMGFSVAVYTTHTNWREAVKGPNGLEAKLTAANAALDNERARYARTERDVAAEKAMLLQSLAKAESANSLLVAERDQLKNAEAKLRQDASAAVGAMDAAHKTLEADRAELTAQRETLAAARTDRDKQFAEVVRLTDLMNIAQGNLDRMRAQGALLAEQVAKARDLLSFHKLNLDMEPSENSPTVDGVVLASRDGAVEISLGADDGLSRGHTLEVFRETTGAYLGRVEIVETRADRAVGKVIPEFSKGIIQKEDRVTTRF